MKYHMKLRLKCKDKPNENSSWENVNLGYEKLLHFHFICMNIWNNMKVYA